MLTDIIYLNMQKSVEHLFKQFKRILLECAKLKYALDNNQIALETKSEFQQQKFILTEIEFLVRNNQIIDCTMKYVIRSKTKKFWSIIHLVL